MEFDESSESDLKMAMEDQHKESSSDELLSPLARMKKYSDSDNIFERQSVVRSALDTLRSVVDIPDDIETVVGVLWKLSDDIEPSVRAELMEQIPHIAVLCHEYRGQLFHIAFQFLLPVVVNYLQDRNNQVRKTSQAALLMMLEQDLVDKGLVQDQVCPIVVRLTEHENFEDFRTEAVALMCKMAPMIGREITEKIFLKTYDLLCTDSLFHVRKMCAANFGVMCTVLSRSEAEDLDLVRRFIYLCGDSIWNVRKACADVFTTVSYTCSLETRYNQLASVFVKLLRDQSRWVRAAAFQALGPFISTFADPSRTGLYFSDDGSHIIRDNRFFEDESSTEEEGEEKTSSNHQNEEEDALLNNNTIPNYPSTNCDKQNSSMLTCDADDDSDDYDDSSSDDDEDDNDGSTETGAVNDNFASNKLSEVELEQCFGTGDSNLVESSERFVKSGRVCCSGKKIDSGSRNIDTRSQLTVSGDSPGHLHVHLDENAFNSFHYWRIPIPELKFDIDIVAGKPVSVNVKAAVREFNSHKVYSSQLDVNIGPYNEFSDKDDDSEFQKYGDSVSDSIKPRKIQSTLRENWSKNELSSYTRIRTASVGMIQEDTQQGVTSNTILVTNANEALVTSVSGKVIDIKQTYGPQCNSPSAVLGRDLPFQNDDSYLGGINSGDIHSQITNEVKKHIDKQNIVPGPLLEHYVTMNDPSHMQLIDNEIPRYCAYSLPAVAMTLGRKNWPILKRLYEILASDMQWKVRRTLAFSIHELAMILGEELAYKDLFPIFNGFIKDLDEVRIGVLQHIADFLTLLRPQERRDCLPKLREFLNTDNELNWRFRLELAEQLGQLASLYQAVEIREFLMPVALLLIADKVSEVRQVAVRIICLLIREMSAPAQDVSLVKCVLTELSEKFARSKKWTNRQTYAFLCYCLICENSLPLEQFVTDVLPHLLYLSSDSVPNVRLTVAKTLSKIIIPLEFYSSRNPHHEHFVQVLQLLRGDRDRDVRFYANLPSPNNLGSGLTNTQLVLPV